MQKISWNRVILGGLLAGLVLALVEIVAGAVIGAWMYKELAGT
jgi:type III secretory pathway component EscV